MSDVTLSDEQWEAVRAIVNWIVNDWPRGKQIFLLEGPAGSGKSTVFRKALEELHKRGIKKAALATFMGKAAAVLRKKGNPDAQTIHSLIYTMDDEDEGADPSADPDGFALSSLPAADDKPRVKRDPNDLKFRVNRFGRATEVDLIGIDESGQVDDPTGADLVSFDKPILAMGDRAQLPPVKGEGLGFFSKMKPDFVLKQVHRQALQSPIIRLATRARMGETIPWGEVDAGEFGSAKVLRLNRANEHHVLRPDTQVICGVHRVRKHVTQKIRHARGFAGEPMAGETIICGKNNRDRKLFNGMQGLLVEAPEPYQRVDGDDAIMSDLQTLVVHMDDHRDALELTAHPWMFRDDLGQEVEQPRMRKGIEWFGFGYVLTGHKSQGSEWPDVTVVDDSGAFREHRHRWLYTAITRASENLTILRRE